MVRLKQNIEWQRVDDEIVVLDLTTSSYLSVNDTGAVLWPLVVDGATEAELARALASRFPIAPDQARTDVRAFVERLRSLSLVDEH
jgi:hypothetical protein